MGKGDALMNLKGKYMATGVAKKAELVSEQIGLEAHLLLGSLC